MRNWKHIEWSESFGYGINHDDSHYIETEIQGWNDLADEDVDNLMTIRTVISAEDDALDVTIIQSYLNDDAKHNFTVRRLYREIEPKIKKEILKYISQ